LEQEVCKCAKGGRREREVMKIRFYVVVVVDKEEKEEEGLNTYPYAKLSPGK
jgi:hypothetical protein